MNVLIKLHLCYGSEMWDGTCEYRLELYTCYFVLILKNKELYSSSDEMMCILIYIQLKSTNSLYVTLFVWG